MKVKLTSFEYGPGDKWSCGHLRLKAETPLGVFEWDEVVPGPRHSEDSRELTVKLAGHALDLDEFEDLLDFEPPGKAGKWASEFAESQDEVQKNLEAWFESSREALEDFLEEETQSE